LNTMARKFKQSSSKMAATTLSQFTTAYAAKF
jgi:hypothetical protein